MALAIHSNHLFLLLLFVLLHAFFYPLSPPPHIKHILFSCLIPVVSAEHETLLLASYMAWHVDQARHVMQARNNTKRKQKVWISLCMLYLEEMVKMVKYSARERYLRDADAASIPGMCRMSMVDAGCELDPYFTVQVEPEEYVYQKCTSFLLLRVSHFSF